MDLPEWLVWSRGWLCTLALALEDSCAVLNVPAKIRNKF